MLLVNSYTQTLTSVQTMPRSACNTAETYREDLAVTVILVICYKTMGKTVKVSVYGNYSIELRARFTYLEQDCVEGDNAVETRSCRSS